MATPITNVKISGSSLTAPSVTEDVAQEEIREDPTDCAICCDDFNMSTKKK